MKVFLLIIISFLSLISCTHKEETPTLFVFLAGDTTGVYQKFDPAIEMNLVLDYNADTTVIDTISIDIDGNGIDEFTFIVSQRFLPNLDYTLVRQTFEVITYEIEVQKQYNYSEVIVKSIIIDDTINVSNNWANHYRSVFTEVHGNRELYPRDRRFYIPFRYPGTNKYGWLKFKTEYYCYTNLFQRFCLEGVCTHTTH